MLGAELQSYLLQESRAIQSVCKASQHQEIVSGNLAYELEVEHSHHEVGASNQMLGNDK